MWHMISSSRTRRIVTRWPFNWFTELSSGYSTPSFELDPLERVPRPSFAGNRTNTAKTKIVSFTLILVRLMAVPIRPKPKPDQYGQNRTNTAKTKLAEVPLMLVSSQTSAVCTGSRGKPTSSSSSSSTAPHRRSHDSKSRVLYVTQ